MPKLFPLFVFDLIISSNYELLVAMTHSNKTNNHDMIIYFFPFRKIKIWNDITEICDGTPVTLTGHITG